MLTRHIDLQRDAVRTVRRIRPFTIDACVVLPDHLHCVWTLPEGDDDFSTRWRVLKAIFAHRVPTVCPRCARRRAALNGAAAARLRRGERGIWQRGFWEHAIRDDEDFAAHVDHVHFNPVKHGYVRAAAEWPHSTFKSCARRGRYPEAWIGPNEQTILQGEWGE